MTVELLLARLFELASAIPRPGCEWEERPRFGPPASPAALSELERVAGFPLPNEFHTFLSRFGEIVAMSVHNGYWLGGPEQLSRAVEAGELPRTAEGESAVPIATDGAGNAFLLSAGTQVWHWNHQTGVVRPVAASFAEFLARVVADWEAYVADTPGWHFLV